MYLIVLRLVSDPLVKCTFPFFVLFCFGGGGSQHGTTFTLNWNVLIDWCDQSLGFCD